MYYSNSLLKEIRTIIASNLKFNILTCLPMAIFHIGYARVGHD